MFDIKCSVSQLQAFVAVVEEGSFSAAARLLDKGQPAISSSISALEEQLSLQLFDRSQRLPVLTSGGQALLPEARRLLYQARRIHETAERWNETERASILSLVLDVIVPLNSVVRLVDNLYSRFPGLTLTLHTEARGAVTARILDDSCELGVTGLLVPNAPEGLCTRVVGGVEFVAVASADHPLLEEGLEVSSERLQAFNQLVLSDPSGLTDSKQVGVMGSKHWMVGNQSTKYRFLLEGYGWGNMPLHEVERALEQGTLVAFKPTHWETERRRVPLHVIRRVERPLTEVAEYAIQAIEEALSADRCGLDRKHAKGLRKGVNRGPDKRRR